MSHSSSPQHSDVATIANTPSPPPEPQGDFARLVPLGEQTESAFHTVVDEYHVHNIQSELADVVHWAEVQDHGGKERRFTGHYRFNFARSNPNTFGWLLGSGLGGDHPGTHIPACVLQERSDHRVSRHHARFHFSESGVLLLSASTDSRRIYLATEVMHCEIGKGNRQHALVYQQAEIRIGRLAYAFEYLPAALHATFKEDLRLFMSRSVIGWQVPSSLSTIGATMTETLGHYQVQEGFAKGTFGRVSAGIHTPSGSAVAVKRLISSHDQIDWTEVRILQRIKAISTPCSGIVLLRDLVTLGAQTGLVLFLQPLLIDTFAQLIVVELREFDVQSRVEASMQAVEAVAWLHEHSFMHRDIKPANIGLKSRVPVQAVLFDFGAATMKPSSINHMVGTIRYLAPEILALKVSGAQPYGRTIDVWAMGLTMYSLITQRNLPSDFVLENPNIPRYQIQRLDDIMAVIEVQPQELGGVLTAMIQYNPEVRSTARAAAGALRRCFEQISHRTSGKVQPIGGRRRRSIDSDEWNDSKQARLTH